VLNALQNTLNSIEQHTYK